MARKVFYSFHYALDNWRVSQVRNIGAVEGQTILSSNEWEDVKEGGDKKIQEWIDEQMVGKSCVVVLIGRETAGRKWVKYEIQKGWNAGKGVVGIYIHNLKDKDGYVTSKGANPFTDFTIDDGATNLSTVVKAYDPSGATSKEVYETIKNNISSWVEEAIAIRNSN